jgi:hypothetical protein
MLWDEGESRWGIAEVMDTSVVTVAKWIDRYEEGDRQTCEAGFDPVAEGMVCPAPLDVRPVTYADVAPVWLVMLQTCEFPRTAPADVTLGTRQPMAGAERLP